MKEYTIEGTVEIPLGKYHEMLDEIANLAGQNKRLTKAIQAKELVVVSSDGWTYGHQFICFADSEEGRRAKAAAEKKNREDVEMMASAKTIWEFIKWRRTLRGKYQ